MPDSKVANIRSQIEREIARLSICDLPPTHRRRCCSSAAVLYIFPAVDVYLRPKCLSRALAAGASVTSQRWIKSRVKLPLKEMNK